MSRRRSTNLLALAVLSCLSERPMHPYEISQTLKRRGKDQSIKLNYGALYSVVESLAAAAFIEARETVREGRRPERTIYTITASGQQEHDEWLAELVSTPVHQYHPLEAALALVLGLPPDEVAVLLGERVTRLRLEIASVQATLEESQRMGLPEVFIIEGRFRQHMLDAELSYTERLARQIRDGSLGGVAAWRRIHELLDAGTPMSEVLADPLKYLGDEGSAFAGPEGGE